MNETKAKGHGRTLRWNNRGVHPYVAALLIIVVIVVMAAVFVLVPVFFLALILIILGVGVAVGVKGTWGAVGGALLVIAGIVLAVLGALAILVIIL